MAAHFQHRPAAMPARRVMAEAGIEEAGVMDAELADQRIDTSATRHHADMAIDAALALFVSDRGAQTVGQAKIAGWY
ncbi:MAG: hypothetical protein OEQ29_22935 [Alphaproteobacteria bacterium]|nr:hypothetical protein [Alphaproteobacteria bacterium]